jgi:hypothetical protein
VERHLNLQEMLKPVSISKKNTKQKKKKTVVISCACAHPLRVKKTQKNKKEAPKKKQKIKKSMKETKKRINPKS